jgi:hypothetical protein
VQNLCIKHTMILMSIFEVKNLILSITKAGNFHMPWTSCLKPIKGHTSVLLIIMIIIIITTLNPHKFHLRIQCQLSLYHFHGQELGTVSTSCDPRQKSVIFLMYQVCHTSLLAALYCALNSSQQFAVSWRNLLWQLLLSCPNYGTKLLWLSLAAEHSF